MRKKEHGKMKFEKAIFDFMKRVKFEDVFLIDVYQGGWLIKNSQWIEKNQALKNKCWEVSKIDTTLKEFLLG